MKIVRAKLEDEKSSFWCTWQATHWEWGEDTVRVHDGEKLVAEIDRLCILFIQREEQAE